MPIVSPPSLSVYLFELTATPEYIKAAHAAAGFVARHMYNGTAIFDTIRLSADFSLTNYDCAILDIPVYSYISGFAIWAFSKLATYNATYGALWVFCDLLVH